MASGIPLGGVQVIVVTTVFLLVAILFLGLRLYARYLQRKKLWLDDWFLIAGTIFTFAVVGVGYSLVLDGGAGVPITEATPDQIANALILFVPAPLLWGFATFFIKLSILFFYISIFSMRNLRMGVYVVIALSVAMMIVIVLETFLLCRPFEFTWNKTIEGVCGNITQAYLSVAIVNLIIDLSIVALPMPVLWSLQMSTKKKRAITIVLALGLVICVLTALRIKAVLELDSLDFTGTMCPDLIYAALEIELGVVNACLPLLRPVLKNSKSMGHFLTSKQKSVSENTRNGKSWHSGKTALSTSNEDGEVLDTQPLGIMNSARASNGSPEIDLEHGHEAPWGEHGIVVQRDIHQTTSQQDIYLTENIGTDPYQQN